MAAKKEFKSARVDAVKAYATEHYDEGGWDIVVETMSDLDIYRIVKHQLSPEGAIRKVAQAVGIKHEQRAEVQAMAGGEDKDVPAEATNIKSGSFNPEAPNGYFKNGKPKPVSKKDLAKLIAAGLIAA